MRLLITAGPTREHLDPVRFLSNASTGKLAYCLATEAIRLGHEVFLVSGPVSISPPVSATLHMISVVSGAEMLAASEEMFPSCDAAIFAAAVCDYRPVEVALRKEGKSLHGLTLQLEATKDIAAILGSTKGARKTMGFALEDHDGRAHAEEKLRRKLLDVVVLNGVETVGSDCAQVEIYKESTGWLAPLRGTKLQIASALVAVMESLVRKTL